MEQKIIETVGPRVETTVEAPTVESQESAVVQPTTNVARYRHIQTDGVYVKMTQMPANMKLYSKKLPTDHLVILASGKLIAELDNRRILFEAPASYIIPARTRVPVTTVEESVWYCIHRTDETDLEELTKAY